MTPEWQAGIVLFSAGIVTALVMLPYFWWEHRRLDRAKRERRG
jgi:hypothetical protein